MTVAAPASTVRHTLSAAGRSSVRRLAADLAVPADVVLLGVLTLALARHGDPADLVVDLASPSGTATLRPPADPGATFRDLLRHTAAAPRDGAWRAAVESGVVAGLAGCGRVDVEAADTDEAVSLTATAETGDGRVLADFLARVDVLARQVAAAPDGPLAEFDPRGEPDRALLAGVNATACDWPGPSTLLARLVARAAAAPRAAAVVEDTRVTTYGELLGRAAAVRDQVRQAGVRPGDVVALAMGRGAGLTAAVLGVWAAGACFLPLDATHPADRLSFQLADAGAAALLVSGGAAPPAWAADVSVLCVPAGTADLTGLDMPLAEDDPAYLIYTSGSTGRPKGVLVSHRGLANVVMDFAGRLGLDESATVLWSTTPAFDISLLEQFLALVTGGCCVVAGDDAQTSPRTFLDLVTTHEVSVAQATPTAWRLVAEETDDELAGRTVLCGGEPLPSGLARNLLRLGCRLFNVYGPTETTIWSTAEELREPVADQVPVGRPVANTRIFVVDRHGREVVPGVPGELCVAGAGVSLGYRDRPELTASRFGTHPEWGRFYRTGDRARLRSDGALELLGRTDRQVKLRGYRIELSEVESVLAELAGVRSVAVVLDGDAQAETGHLVAFVCAEPAPDARALVTGLRDLAAARLPHYAVPARYLLLDELPTTHNRKIDHNALAARLCGGQ